MYRIQSSPLGLCLMLPCFCYAHFQVNIPAPSLLPDPIIQPQTAGSCLSLSCTEDVGLWGRRVAMAVQPSKAPHNPAQAAGATGPGMVMMGSKCCCHSTQQGHTLGSTTAPCEWIPAGTLHSGSSADLGFMPSF